MCVPISASQLECPQSVDELNLRHLHVRDRPELLELELHDHKDVQNRSPKRTPPQPCLVLLFRVVVRCGVLSCLVLWCVVCSV